MYQRATLPSLVAGLALLAAPAVAPAADAREERVPITDPALLEQFGFEPDATNVHATPRAYEELSMSPVERGVVDATIAEAEANGPFGIEERGVTPVLYNQFFPRSNLNGMVGLYGDLNHSRYCAQGSWLYETQIESLPHGATLDYVDAYLVDDVAGNDDYVQAWLFRTCLSNTSGGEPQIVILGVGSTIGQSGNVRILVAGSPSSPLGEDIDQRKCSYMVSVSLEPLGGACNQGENLRIQKVRAVWRRQVSPAPNTATFGDVPTDHPFFQHIEALAASGITGGCGDGTDFCPGAPLTRGQMAVFLSKALGLHWGEISQ